MQVGAVNEGPGPENEGPGPANEGLGPANAGPGPANDDPGHRDQVEAAAGQSSEEREDRDRSPSQAWVRHRGRELGLDPSLLPNYVIMDGDSGV
jgi:hypothetical protein